MSLSPTHRPSCAQALAHPFFTNSPLPTPHAKLSRPISREEAPLQQAKGHAIKIERPEGYESPGPLQPAAKRRHFEVDVKKLGSLSPQAA